MSSKQGDPKHDIFPKEILPGQAYMARSSKEKWPEPHHWLTGHQASQSSQVQQESWRQPSNQPQETSPYQIPGSKDSTQPYQGSQTALVKAADKHPVEDEYLSLNEVLTPSTANAEPESSHQVRQRRKAAERDPWTASLERSGGVNYYGPATTASAPSRPSNSPASGHVSTYHDAREQPSQKQQSGSRSGQVPTKAGDKWPSKTSGSSRQREKPALGDAHEGETDDYVFLM